MNERSGLVVRIWESKDCESISTERNFEPYTFTSSVTQISDNVHEVYYVLIFSYIYRETWGYAESATQSSKKRTNQNQSQNLQLSRSQSPSTMTLPCLWAKLLKVLHPLPSPKVASCVAWVRQCRGPCRYVRPTCWVLTNRGMRPAYGTRTPSRTRRHPERVCLNSTTPPLFDEAWRQVGDRATLTLPWGWIRERREWWLLKRCVVYTNPVC